MCVYHHWDKSLQVLQQYGVLCVLCLTEAECESGNQQEVVHPSASSPPAIDSSHSEKASPQVADNDKVCVLYNNRQAHSRGRGGVQGVETIPPPLQLWSTSNTGTKQQP